MSFVVDCGGTLVTCQGIDVGGVQIGAQQALMLQNQGVEWVGRYLNVGQEYPLVWSEIEWLHQFGIQIALIWSTFEMNYCFSGQNSGNCANTTGTLQWTSLNGSCNAGNCISAVYDLVGYTQGVPVYVDFAECPDTAYMAEGADLLTAFGKVVQAAGMTPCLYSSLGPLQYMADTNPMALWPFWVASGPGLDVKTNLAQLPSCYEAISLSGYVPYGSFSGSVVDDPTLTLQGSVNADLAFSGSMSNGSVFTGSLGASYTFSGQITGTATTFTGTYDETTGDFTLTATNGLSATGTFNSVSISMNGLDVDQTIASPTGLF